MLKVEESNILRHKKAINNHIKVKGLIPDGMRASFRRAVMLFGSFRGSKEALALAIHNVI